MSARRAAVVLAAGRGTRFKASGGTGPSKLVATVAAKPMLRHVVEAALASAAAPVIVVTGHARDAVEAALAGLAVRLVHNAAFADGLSCSVKAGIAAVPPDADGAIVLLGDMPMVTPALIDRLLDAVEPDIDAVLPAVRGRRGNPVYLARRLFPAVAHLEGDAGARHLLRGDTIRVREVQVDDSAVWLDIDESGDLPAPDP